jgi:hypothetical protein
LKKLAAIALLLVFLVNTMGYFVLFRYNHFLAKREMVSRIRNGDYSADVVLLKILNPERSAHFKRIEKKEFTWYGRLYDIVSERRDGDTALIYCLHDKKEQELLTDYTLYLRRKSDSTPADNSIIALLYNLVTQALVTDPPNQAPGQATAVQYPVTQSSLETTYPVNTAPPPESA